ncbi:uncharacterized protein LOC130249622 [Oenanthe melanoleuca]|uniref:uncharacterized protein LOC130249622 n=1 Tax=Oenanthe melanoleuca TaxID=2939378 RepID=UPI0024C1BF24|nr:uncharacterized protein LOC130249622 [Oenanthe melanoleuca]
MARMGAGLDAAVWQGPWKAMDAVFCDIAALVTAWRSRAAGRTRHTRREARAAMELVCSTMLGRTFPWLMLLGLIAILGRPVDIPSLPATDTDTAAVLDDILEQQDVYPEKNPSGHTMLPSWGGIALDLLVTGVSFGWWLRRRWRQEKRQRPSDSPGTGCHGYECRKELLQLLRDNRALMRMCLGRRPLPGEKRLRKWGLWKRRRLYFSP